MSGKLSCCRMSAALVTKSLYWYRRVICPCDQIIFGMAIMGWGILFHKIQHISLVFFLSFSLYFSVFLRMYTLFLVVFIFFYLFSVCLSSESRVDHFCSLPLFLSLSQLWLTRLSIRLSLRLSVKSSHFLLLLQNHNSI